VLLPQKGKLETLDKKISTLKDKDGNWFNNLDDKKT
jgi:hypothetical protein